MWAGLRKKYGEAAVAEAWESAGGSTDAVIELKAEHPPVETVEKSPSADVKPNSVAAKTQSTNHQASDVAEKNSSIRHDGEASPGVVIVAPVSVGEAPVLSLISLEHASSMSGPSSTPQAPPSVIDVTMEQFSNMTQRPPGAATGGANSRFEVEEPPDLQQSAGPEEADIVDNHIWAATEKGLENDSRLYEAVVDDDLRSLQGTKVALEGIESNLSDFTERKSSWRLDSCPLDTKAPCLDDKEAIMQEQPASSEEDDSGVRACGIPVEEQEFHGVERSTSSSDGVGTESRRTTEVNDDRERGKTPMLKADPDSSNAAAHAEPPSATGNADGTSKGRQQVGTSLSRATRDRSQRTESKMRTHKGKPPGSIGVPSSYKTSKELQLKDAKEDRAALSQELSDAKLTWMKRQQSKKNRGFTVPYNAKGKLNAKTETSTQHWDCTLLTEIDEFRIKHGSLTRAQSLERTHQDWLKCQSAQGRSYAGRITAASTHAPAQSNVGGGIPATSRQFKPSGFSERLSGAMSLPRNVRDPAGLSPPPGGAAWEALMAKHASTPSSLGSTSVGHEWTKKAVHAPAIKSPRFDALARFRSADDQREATLRSRQLQSTAAGTDAAQAEPDATPASHDSIAPLKFVPARLAFWRSRENRSSGAPAPVSPLKTGQSASIRHAVQYEAVSTSTYHLTKFEAVTSRDASEPSSNMRQIEINRARIQAIRDRRVCNSHSGALDKIRLGTAI